MSAQKSMDRATQQAAEQAAKREALASVPGAPKLEVSAYKECRGMEGPAFSYTLLVDGQKAAMVENSGTGGGTYGRFLSKALETRVQEYLAKVPPIPCYGSMIPMDMELLLGELAEDHVEIVRLKRDCKTRVVFRKDPTAPWVSFKGAFTAESRAYAVKNYGEQVEFANERIAGQTAVEEDAEAKEARMLQPYLKRGLGVFRSAKTDGKWKITNALLSPSVRATMERSYGPGVEFYNDRKSGKAA